MKMMKKMNLMTYSLTEDLWTLILARLPLKCIATFKLVCKQWKSIAESQFLRELFFSHHQNSHSSWSVMWPDKAGFRNKPKEVMAHYGCKVWGLPRSLDSYVSSFINGMTTKETQNVKVLAYTDVGFILISSKSVSGDDQASYYVANPISRQYVKIPPVPRGPFHLRARFSRPSGLVTWIENGDLLRYKVVLMDRSKSEGGFLRLLIYSSETCLWSFKTLNSYGPLCYVDWFHPVSLSGNLHWYGLTSDYKVAVVSHDFYATGTESDRCMRMPISYSDTSSEGLEIDMGWAYSDATYGIPEASVVVI
ncbi:putative F-box protein At3g28280 [Eutrema salsugineum]|uniref:putative F-box protein At3g28280 n=1 Tax=Eutrema salsugineum TaxID=72664 RepID=UPI000CED72F9|nr:putative F-box protein At3g28280 [Eutrema salsugineum]